MASPLTQLELRELAEHPWLLVFWPEKYLHLKDGKAIEHIAHPVPVLIEERGK